MSSYHCSERIAGQCRISPHRYIVHAFDVPMTEQSHCASSISMQYHLCTGSLLHALITIMSTLHQLLEGIIVLADVNYYKVLYS